MLRLVLCAAALTCGRGLITLRTRARVATDPQTLHTFLATPANWCVFVLHQPAPGVVEGNNPRPCIVLSSTGVAAVGREGAVDRPLRPRDAVDEAFGVPVVLPLSVRWVCDASDARRGVLDVSSKEGLKGVASETRMLFQITSDDGGGGGGGASSEVELEMSYEPASLLAYLAAPVLVVDNALALRVLLPNAFAPPLDRFRRLMGALFGVAGVAHAADLAASSTLLTAAHIPTFSDLGPAGQAAAAVWALAGPAAFVASRSTKGVVNDAGLFLYGAIEVACALAATRAFGLENGALLANALGVHAIVAASWLYSRSSAPRDPASSA